MQTKGVLGRGSERVMQETTRRGMQAQEALERVPKRAQGKGTQTIGVHERAEGKK